MRPDMYRKVVKPHHARLYAFAKSHTKAKLMLHSDGAVAPLIPDFIEMGIDILNPVQGRQLRLAGNAAVWHCGAGGRGD